MSHHIYHTRGIILSSQATGESNRYYKIFTKELGLVGGTAQSVREGKSKLRYTLQDYSLITADFVRGKEVWRIISAGQWRSLDAIKHRDVERRLLARFCSLLSRLLQGEGRDEELFEEIIRVVDFLETQNIPSSLELSFETLATLRVLVHLGYIDPSLYSEFLGPQAYTLENLEQFEKLRSGIIPKINDALHASHL